MFKWFSKMNLIQKLIVFFIFLIVVPIFLVDWFVSVKVAKLTEDQIGSTLFQLVKTSHLTLDRVITSVDGTTEKLMVTQETQQMFDLSSVNEYDNLQRFLALDKLITTYSNNTLKFSIFIPTLTDTYPFAPTSDIQEAGVFYSQDIASMGWFKDAVKAKGTGIISVIDQLGNNTNHLKTVAYIRKMSNTSGGDTPIGVLVVSGLNNLLGKDLNLLKIPKDGVILLLNKDNIVLTHTSNTNEIGSTFMLPIKATEASEGVYMEKEKGESWLYAIHTSGDSDTKLLLKIPVNSIIGEHLAVRQLVNYLMIAYFFILIIISIYFFRYILNPLSRLARLTRSFEPGRPLSIDKTDRKDEIGLLNNAFIEMTKRLNQTIHDKYVLELKQKEAELTLLHSQINPHLLYNTLESIYWRTTIEGDPESAEMIHDLSMLMRIGLSRGKSLIQISEELNHVEAYIRLQLKRYSYSFTIHWNVEEETKQYLIPKVVLQPLAENAIIHGIRNMEQEGEMWISIQAFEDRIKIIIEDNGYKTTDLIKLNAILDGGYPEEGFGIKNVNKRIKLHFGESYGLSYELRPEGGTRAIIILPAIKEELI